MARARTAGARVSRVWPGAIRNNGHTHKLAGRRELTNAPNDIHKAASIVPSERPTGGSLICLGRCGCQRIVDSIFI